MKAARTALSEARGHYASGGRLTDDEIGWLTVLLLVTAVRDLAWRRIDRTGDAGWWVWERLWTDVLSRCDPQFAAPPGMLLSYTMWRAGDGLRANIAVTRALEADPDYPAAHLMVDILTRALSPAMVHRPDPSQRRPRMAPGQHLVRGRARRRRKR
jgi:hypothetical protein